MACGNNEVSRDHLSSQPSQPTVPGRGTTPAPRTSPPKELPPPKAQVKAPSKAQAKAPPKAQTKGPKAQPKTRKGKPYASRHDPKKDEIHRFLDKSGEPHVAWAYPHLHVIHKEQTGEVVLVNSLGPGKEEHVDRIELKGNPSGNKVEAAIADLTERLRERSE